MQGSLDRPPITIHRTLVAVAWVTIVPVVLGLLIFVLSGGLQPYHGTMVRLPFLGAVSALLLLAAFPVAAALPLWAFIGGVHLTSRIEIGPEGFSQKVGWVTRTFAWAEVSNFHTKELIGRRDSQRIVIFDYHSTPEKMHAVLRGDFLLKEGQARLWPHWEIQAWELSKLLTEAQARWQGGGQG